MEQLPGKTSVNYATAADPTNTIALLFLAQAFGIFDLIAVNDRGGPEVQLKWCHVSTRDALLRFWLWALVVVTYYV